MHGDTIHAYAYDEREGFPFIATHWYWQIGNMWVAVVAEWEPLQEWMEEINHLVGPVNLSPPPEPHVYNIHETPPFGTLMYRDSTGTIHTQHVTPQTTDY